MKRHHKQQQPHHKQHHQLLGKMKKKEEKQPAKLRDVLPNQGLRWAEVWPMGRIRRDMAVLGALEMALARGSGAGDGAGVAPLVRDAKTKAGVSGALVEVFARATELALERPYGDDEEQFMLDLSLRCALGRFLSVELLRALFHTTILAGGRYFSWCDYANKWERQIPATLRCPLSDAVDKWRETSKDMHIGKLDSMIRAEDAIEKEEEGQETADNAANELNTAFGNMEIDDHEQPEENDGSWDWSEDSLVISHYSYHSDEDGEKEKEPEKEDEEQEQQQQQQADDEEDEEQKKIREELWEEMLEETTEAVEAMDLED